MGLVKVRKEEITGAHGKIQIFRLLDANGFQQRIGFGEFERAPAEVAGLRIPALAAASDRARDMEVGDDAGIRLRGNPRPLSGIGIPLIMRKK